LIFSGQKPAISRGFFDDFSQIEQVLFSHCAGFFVFLLEVAFLGPILAIS